MRCYFLAQGHIQAVEVLEVASDEEAIKKASALFEERRHDRGFEAFEVWDRDRMVFQPDSQLAQPASRLEEATSTLGGVQPIAPRPRQSGR